MNIVTIKSAGMLPKVVEVEDGTTYQDALRQAGIDTQGKSLSVNGDTVDVSASIYDDCTVRLSKSVAGA